MAHLIMMCTQCAREIDTRIDIDRATFDQLPEIESEMVCPECGAKNFWDKSRARLQGGADPAV